MVRKITINGEEYYEVYDPATNKVSDIFKDWKDIPLHIAKLKKQN